MITNLYLASASFEPVYGALEQHPGIQVEVWGLERGRRVALLAYGDGPGDSYGWADWARTAAQDPSQLLPLFPTLELVADSTVTDQLKAALPGVFSAAPT